MIQTARLLLRQWKADDLPVFAHMNADPRVMAYFPSTLSKEESDALAGRIQAKIAETGFGLWALEIPGQAAFAGFVGLAVPNFDASFTPCVEIGWRLSPDHWGRGYATEAAKAVLRFAFEERKMPEIVSLTAALNMPSRRVMERLGMHRTAVDDFEHPQLPAGHLLLKHVLFRLRREEWLEAMRAS